VNGATFKLAQGVSPGLIVSIFGSSIGPASPVGVQLTADGSFSNVLDNTQVLFDDVPAPLIFVYATQINAIVPYSVAGKTSTKVVVKRNGQTSAAVTVPVAGASPGFFVDGNNAVRAYNQDGLINSVLYPARRGSVVVFYGTGEGQTNPPGVDGRVANSVFPKPTQDVGLAIGGQTANILYSGAAPSLVSGVLQVNATVPTNITPGNSVPVVLTVGSHDSPAGVTMFVLAPDPTRVGQIAYFNNGTADVAIKVFDPSEKQVAAGTVPGGKNFYIGSVNTVTNEYGIQANGGPERVISHVCDWQPSFGGYWLCQGNATQPFPR